MQQSMSRFFTACKNLSLTISTKKTEVFHQSAPQKMYVEPTITTEGEILKAVEKFTYLSSTLTRCVNIDNEVDTCIAEYLHLAEERASQVSRPPCTYARHTPPKKLLCGELAEDKRTQGGQKKCFKDTMKVSMRSSGIDLDSWETLAQDRPDWQSYIGKGATSYEQSKNAEGQKKYELCKSIANPADHLCLTCARAF
ncbi:hypothetical protein NDU88_008186 [Pleurodeles waltl]|uniref:Uncharacterized protein n=1 Tax=Pleurodeles waltl TaxID=8319 RepID=A0AAV7VRT9_PLEWA|nr:hypothetical protein NDU88_008186 [Pleurodeles waltl]